MRKSKISCCMIAAIFLLAAFTVATVNAQDDQFTNYTIKKDGTVEPNNGAITCNGNNYFLTQNISGTVVIQRDDAVFNGQGYTVKGNAVKGTYNLDDSILYLEGGFNLTKAWNATVQNVRVENCVNGITLVNAYYCKILNCTMAGNAVDGIKIAWSSNNSIIWNEFISNADDAIQLINAENNNIMSNNMNPGMEYRVNGNGLQLNGNCSNNKIKGNNFTAFDTAVFMDALSGNCISNTVSYNNFVDNKWNGAAISGTNNTVTLNNFYNNGLISQGDNNCSGNYWNINPSIYDHSPLNAPVDTNITPEIILIPQPEPTPTITPTPTTTSTSNLMGPMVTPAPKPTSTNSPTPKPSENTDPTVTPTPTPTSEPTNYASDWTILLIAIVIVSFVALSFVSFVSKRRTTDAKPVTKK